MSATACRQAARTRRPWWPAALCAPLFSLSFALSCVLSFAPGAQAASVVLEGGGVGIAPIAGCDLASEGGDWIDDQERTYRRVVPRPCDLSLDDPPLFWWTPLLGAGPVRYRLTVVRDGTPEPVARIDTDRPYARLDHALGAGSYRWWVAASAPGRASLTSRVRRFALDPARSIDSVVPGAAETLARLVDPARGRPRMFPAPATAGSAAGTATTGTSTVTPLTAATFAQRGADAAHDYARVLESAGHLAAQAPDDGQSERARLALDQSTRDLAALTVLGIAARLAQRDDLRAAGHARLLALAAGARDGSAALAQCDYDNDLAREQYALALARGLDLFADALAASERAAVADAALALVRPCMAQMLAPEVFATSFPYRSHEAHQIHLLIQTLALLAGTSDEADRAWLVYWDLYASATHLWGVQDGSDGNGTGYGWGNFTDVPAAFLTLRNALGADYFSQRAYFRGLGRRLIYFSPPVAPLDFVADPPFTGALTPAESGPVNVFGDGESDVVGSYWFRINIDRAFRVYAALVDDPLYRWYRRAGIARYPFLDAADEAPPYRALALLAPPTPAGDAAFPAGTPPFQAFADAGVVALHDDLADPQRGSMYFVSSPFGSFSHSAAEQNSFVLHLAGEPVLIGAGYYDSYFSPHHAGYTRRTLAKNALTYDGGHGQAETLDGRHVPTMDFSGRLLNAWSGRALDVATGDATLAYRVCTGAPTNPGCTKHPYLAPITRAIRSVAHLRDARDGAFFVYDRIEATAPHQWEWNLHSYRRFELVSDGVPFTLRAFGPSGRQSVCIDLYGPPLAFEQTDAFPIAPGASADVHARFPNQWHAVLRTRDKLAAATFVAVLREQCAARAFAVRIDQGTGGARLAVGADGARALEFEGARVRIAGFD